MKIAFIHFHLKTGGVTTVIREQAKVMASLGWEALVLSGHAPEGDFPAHVCEIPGLAYDEKGTHTETAGAVANAIIEAMHGRWSCNADIVHIHNPTLAKNRNLQAIIKRLQRAGLRLLCQIHDFAEDGRPTAFFREAYAVDCHYVVINGRDKALLIESGLCSQGLHLLPNPVPPMPSGSGCQLPQSAHVLYPARAIRRKNIGEAILLSLYFDKAAPLAITLPPNSPIDMQSYTDWRKFVDRHHLRVDFEVGLQTAFSDLIQGCRYVLTTSITEGFGFSFLEAWAAGKALWGRLLPAICKDFIDQGIRLDHLYQRLLVPLKWIDAPALARRWKSALDRAAAQYGCPVEKRVLASAWKAVCRDQKIDFGLLDERAQRRVIEIVMSEKRAFQKLRRLNPFLDPAGPPADCSELIRRNRTAVARYYNPDAYAQRLQELYTHVLSHPVRQAIDKKRLIRAFLMPQQFSLLKWGNYLG